MSIVCLLTADYKSHDGKDCLLKKKIIEVLKLIYNMLVSGVLTESAKLFSFTHTKMYMYIFLYPFPI